MVERQRHGASNAGMPVRVWLPALTISTVEWLSGMSAPLTTERSLVRSQARPFHARARSSVDQSARLLPSDWRRFESCRALAWGRGVTRKHTWLLPSRSRSNRAAPLERHGGNPAGSGARFENEWHVHSVLGVRVPLPPLLMLIRGWVAKPVAALACYASRRT